NLPAESPPAPAANARGGGPCGAGMTTRSRALYLLAQQLELEPALLRGGELRLGGAERLAGLRERLPVAGVECGIVQLLVKSAYAVLQCGDLTGKVCERVLLLEAQAALGRLAD